jgi:hypothetical protein
MERPFLWASVLASLWALLLFLACFFDEAWWPMFNVFFVALGLLPYIFGSHHSSGLWGALGDFITGVIVVSLFAYPVVLHNAEVIGPEALTTISMSTFFLVAAIWITVSSLT